MDRGNASRQPGSAAQSANIRLSRMGVRAAVLLMNVFGRSDSVLKLLFAAATRGLPQLFGGSDKNNRQQVLRRVHNAR